MRPPRLLTFALVRDPRLPHLLRSLLSDLWKDLAGTRRRLVVASSFEEVADHDAGDRVEAVLVEVSGAGDALHLSGVRDAAPDARLIAIPTSLLLTPLVGTSDPHAALVGDRATLLRSLDAEGLRHALDATRQVG